MSARLRVVLAPVIFGVVALLLWQWLVTAKDIQPYVLPSPSAIWGQFSDNLGIIRDAAITTAKNALLGLIIGTFFGIVWAALAAAVRPIEQMAAPIVVALSVIPIVALAPVLYAMFGAAAQTGRVLVAAIAAFVPVYVNSLRGLRTVAPLHRDLMRSYAATGWQATRAVTLPGAVPFVFTGIRIASSVAVISALIAEYFGGPLDGLGISITSAVSSSRYSLAWAFVLGSVIIGLLFYCVTYALEALVTRHRT
ncbi:ABC transporter permease [Branchiibius sp. NY16-3462-2]|uniref:ABC transporter permease n=1 Tax=Branchiibius sp. NY16-3462-2 TaxID=1807500 RepID=UPI000794F47F|nr:ABC transporter permease subunit [Branchiibius sp. NY16-3462-2]KYH45938.1 nitrate ABC transporter permease [Branchiibius sp. NY16-3462-2]